MSEPTDPTTDEHYQDPDAVDHEPLERAERAIDEAKGAASAAVGHGARVGVPDDDAEAAQTED